MPVEERLAEARHSAMWLHDCPEVPAKRRCLLDTFPVLHCHLEELRGPALHSPQVWDSRAH